jgi:hypothetical protein
MAVNMLRHRSALSADHIFTTAHPLLPHQWPHNLLSSHTFCLDVMSDGNSQRPSRRHARVLSFHPETIGTAVTLNVVKCLEPAPPLIFATLCLKPPTAESTGTSLCCLCPPLPALNNLIAHTDKPRFRLYEAHVRVQRSGRQPYPPSGTPRSTLRFFFMLSRSSEPCVTRLRIGTLADGCRVAWFSPNRQHRCTEASGRTFQGLQQRGKKNQLPGELPFCRKPCLPA